MHFDGSTATYSSSSSNFEEFHDEMAANIPAASNTADA